MYTVYFIAAQWKTPISKICFVFSEQEKKPVTFILSLKTLIKKTPKRFKYIHLLTHLSLMTCGYLWSSRLIFMSHQTYLQAILHFHLAHYTNNECMDEWAKSPEEKFGLSRWFCLKSRIKITIHDFPEQSLTDVCMPISEYRLPMNDPNFNRKCQPKALLWVMCKV